MKKWLFLLLVIIILIISSSMTYEQQSILPELEDVLAHKPFEQQLSVLKIPYWDTVVSIEERGYFRFVEFLLRKLTHFLGFGCIALAIYFVWGKRRYAAIGTIVSTMLIAVVDEFRQSFTPGRIMSWQDVVVDTVGAFCFTCILLLIKNRKERIR
ncbi:VanZ family protein [Lysinibacillus piscis]|uniref:Membrane protein n=1 Tax=Lysinibacillus piscis TaxID=2518931 RepID=A0ABQ5NFQ3_9BACI|nr:VanZ family protein [Lysinibacillus sp. KH24]GLC87223.1 membrane protein [Lysinibacillus sp. KH24]